jgi:N4-(beta-N-acetylglucosaminyl)-L-asparaginase
MKTRREFLKVTVAGTAAIGFADVITATPVSQKPIVISTWDHGFKANEAAWAVLSKNGRAVDAVEKGVNVTESDPEVTSVGKGGYPDRDGRVTLDACIMNEFGDCGSVAFLEHIDNPISVARLVMEKTPHIMLAGEGALAFALENGFKKTNLLTPKAEKAWKEWLKQSNYKPHPDFENHDTIGMLAIDAQGNLGGACTTSGLAWKMHGRIGDSPIIGAGLYVDNEVGAACATGIGEMVIRQCGSFLIVEMMRQGKSPDEACKIAVERIIKHEKEKIKEEQVGFLAMNKNGEVGSYAVRTGFEYARFDSQGNRMVNSKFVLGER